MHDCMAVNIISCCHTQLTIEPDQLNIFVLCGQDCSSLVVFSWCWYLFWFYWLFCQIFRLLSKGSMMLFFVSVVGVIFHYLTRIVDGNSECTWRCFWMAHGPNRGPSSQIVKFEREGRLVPSNINSKKKLNAQFQCLCKVSRSRWETSCDVSSSNGFFPISLWVGLSFYYRSGFLSM